MRNTIIAQEAKNHIDRIGASLGCDFTYSPSFPEGDDTICLVTRAVEDGHSYGYSVVYVVWKTESGIHTREIRNTRSSKDNLYYHNLRVEDGKLKFTLEKSGTYSGNPSKEDMSLDLAQFV